MAMASSDPPVAGRHRHFFVARRASGREVNRGCRDLRVPGRGRRSVARAVLLRNARLTFFAGLLALEFGGEVDRAARGSVVAVLGAAVEGGHFARLELRQRGVQRPGPRAHGAGEFPLEREIAKCEPAVTRSRSPNSA